MNIKIIVVSILTLVLLAGIVLVHNYLSKPEEEGTPFVMETGDEPEETSEEIFKETLLTKEGFEITLPPGWQEVPGLTSVLLMAVDAQEEIVNENVDFMTNLSIKKDDLGNYEHLNSAEEYIENVKVSLIQIISVIEFTDEKEGTINNNNAFFVECKSTQEEVDFKTLLVFIEESSGVIWGLSFNTFQESWPNYRPIFYQMTESFNLKND